MTNLLSPGAADSPLADFCGAENDYFLKFSVHLPFFTNLLAIFSRRRLALFSDDVYILVFVNLPLTYNRYFRPAPLAEEVDPYPVALWIDHALKASPHLVELLDPVEFHLKDAVLDSITKVLQDLCYLGTALVVGDIIGDHVKHKTPCAPIPAGNLPFRQKRGIAFSLGQMIRQTLGLLTKSFA